MLQLSTEFKYVTKNNDDMRHVLPLKKNQFQYNLVLKINFKSHLTSK